MTKEQGIEERCRWNCAWKGGGPCLARTAHAVTRFPQIRW